jgi:hypothetical protein
MIGKTSPSPSNGLSMATLAFRARDNDLSGRFQGGSVKLLICYYGFLGWFMENSSCGRVSGAIHNRMDTALSTI